MLCEEILALCARRKGEVESDRLLRCADVLQELCSRNQHAELLNDYLQDHISNEGLADDEYKEILTSGKFIILAQSDDALLVVLRQSHLSNSIYSAPIRFVERNLSPGAVDYNIYELPEDFAENVFDRNVRLQPARAFRGVEQALIVKDVREALDFTSVTQLPRISLRIAFPLEGRYEWCFDRQTLSAMSYTSLSLSDSGIADMLDLLSSMRAPTTVSVIDSLIHHPEHFVRWKAIQAAGLIDRTQALEMVRTALDDPHPAIRAAAKTTLAHQNTA